MNRTFRAVLLAVVLTASSAVTALAQSPPALALDLAIHAAEAPASVAGTLTIKNTGDEAVTVQKPGGWMVSAFVVLNSLGNVVKPEGIAKVNRPGTTVTIAAHSEYQHSFSNLEFLTGSALFGYTLTSGETYRVIAVYRPHAAYRPPERRDETGITSTECIFSVK